MPSEQDQDHQPIPVHRRVNPKPSLLDIADFIFGPLGIEATDAPSDEEIEEKCRVVEALATRLGVPLHVPEWGDPEPGPTATVVRSAPFLGGGDHFTPDFVGHVLDGNLHLTRVSDAEVFGSYFDSPTQEQREVLEAFVPRLQATSKDGGRKRAAGLKPSWRIDEHRPALFSHLRKWAMGETIDPDSGVHTLWHLAWRACAIAWQEENPEEVARLRAEHEAAKAAVEGASLLANEAFESKGRKVFHSFNGWQDA